MWTLLNGQGRVRKAPNEAYDTPNPEANGIANLDESSCFYGNPSQYDWTYIDKKELLVPYNCNKMLFGNLQDMSSRIFRQSRYRALGEASRLGGRSQSGARRYTM